MQMLCVTCDNQITQATRLMQTVFFNYANETLFYACLSSFSLEELNLTFNYRNCLLSNNITGDDGIYDLLSLLRVCSDGKFAVCEFFDATLSSICGHSRSATTIVCTYTDSRHR